MNIGWLLLKNSGKHGSLKFVITIIATALGTLMLLSVFSVSHATNRITDRQIWQDAIFTNNAAAKLSVDELLQPSAVLMYRSGVETFLGKTINKYDAYFTGGDLPARSPLAVYPGAGEYYVSPALDSLLSQYSDDTLRDRFDGKQAGIIPDSALGSPEELTLVRGISEADLRDTKNDANMNVVRVTDFRDSPFGRDYQRRSEIITTSMMAVGAIALIVPILLLITTATTLGAREREERYAALRLIGATKRQVSQITLIDSLLAAIFGVALGGIVYLLFRPFLVYVNMTGLRSFPDDVVVNLPTMVLIFVAIVGMVWLANRKAMRQVITSPLGVARQQKLRKPPRVWLVLPLIIGLAGLIYFATLTQQEATRIFGDTYALLLLGLFVFVLLGLLLAGSWLMKLYGWLIGVVNKKAAGVLVSRRIRFEARAIYRGIAGVVVAFYAGAFFITSFSAISNMMGAYETVLDRNTPDGALQIFDADQETINAVLETTNLYDTNPVQLFQDMRSDDVGTEYISCHDVARLTEQVCSDMNRYVQTAYNDYGDMFDMDKTVSAETIHQLENPVITYTYLPEDGVVSDGVTAERSVTALRAIGDDIYVTIISQATRDVAFDAMLLGIKRLLYGGIILTIIVAAINLIIATVAGLFDRKRSFFTLRLGGAELTFLKRIVLKESMLPLVFISLLSITLGLFTSYVFIKLTSALLFQSFVLPEPLFWVCVVAIFIISYVGIRLVLPLLDRLTRMEDNRSE